MPNFKTISLYIFIGGRYLGHFKHGDFLKGTETNYATV